MKKDTKRSPLKKDSLRHAGQSLDVRIIETIFDKMLAPVSIILLLSILTALEWARVFLNIPNMPWVYTTITLILIIYYSPKAIKSLKEIDNIKLGRDGERIVAEALEELRAIGYKIYNDIVSESFNIDHVVIGPAGVFTVETKTYRKNIGNNPQINYNGQTITIDNAAYPNNPIKQAKGQMYWLNGFIRDYANIAVNVVPVVVFPGWFINKPDNNSEVLVFNEKSFVGFLKTKQKILNQEQVDLVASHIESYCRNN